MKYALVFLVSTITTVTAFAETSRCTDAKLSFNSHANIECPAATKICVKNLDEANKTAASIILVDGQRQTLELDFNSYDLENYYDVSSHLIYNFSKAGQYAAYEVETDQSYPHPTETGTFSNLSLSTGKKSMDQSVYPSQQCSYEVIKK